MKKRTKMTFSTKDIPDQIYKILDEKARSRSLAPFIIELITNKEKHEKVISKLTTIEEMLKSVSIPSTRKVQEALAEPEWSTGRIIFAKEVSGGIEEEDEKEVDF
ncbi:hypothetical protein [Ectobacillus polymachus]|uniref:hypothetical protein n=1 Tax=Ectobacillus polymachus TaxID=1508806 RepID=UPI003A84B225